MNTALSKLLALMLFTSSAVALFSIYTRFAVPHIEPSARPILSWDPAIELHKSSATLADIKPDRFSVLTAKPLFSPTRQPFTPPPSPAQPVAVVEPVAVVPPSPPAPPVEPMFDVGLIAMKGTKQQDGQWQALITSPQSPEGDWLSVGEAISGWKIQLISPNDAILAQHEHVHTLQLYVDNRKVGLGSGGASQ